MIDFKIKSSTIPEHGGFLGIIKSHDESQRVGEEGRRLEGKPKCTGALGYSQIDARALGVFFQNDRFADAVDEADAHTRVVHFVRGVPRDIQADSVRMVEMGCGLALWVWNF